MFRLPADDLENIFSRLKGIWPENKTFLFTGGTGFFGRWMVEAIALLETKLNTQNKFIILSRQGRDELFEKIPVLSLSCFATVQKDIQLPFQLNEDVNYVVHAASDVALIKNAQSSDYSAIVAATENVIAATRSLNGKFLYVSSGGVYPATNTGANEDDLQLAKAAKVDSYAEAKRQSEILVATVPKHCIARCFSFVGPYADAKMAVMDMLAKKAAHQPIVVNSPQVIRSFMYPSDLVVALFKLLLLPNKNSVYNLGSDSAINLGELAQKIAALHNNSEVRLQESSNNISLAGQCYYPNMQRFDSEYDNAVTIDLKTALAKTLDFLNQRKSA